MHDSRMRRVMQERWRRGDARVVVTPAAWRRLRCGDARGCAGTWPQAIEALASRTGTKGGVHRCPAVCAWAAEAAPDGVNVGVDEGIDTGRPCVHCLALPDAADGVRGLP